MDSFDCSDARTNPAMSDVTSDGLANYLSGRLGPEVEIADYREHVEGWSRDTISVTASWTAEGQPRSERLVVRAESDAQIEGREGQGNDIETEFRTMAAAQDAPVVVPETYWYEDDPNVFGGRFFIVEYLDGSAPVTWDPRERTDLYDAWDDPDRTLPDQFVDAVAGIHEIDPTDVDGIDDVPADRIVDREIDRWESVYRRAAPVTEPALEEALRWFRANAPEVPETTLVHGDFRIGNVLVDGDDLTGVLDWELARAGDPLYDLGYASTNYFAGKLIEPIERPELACSLLEREWFYDEYESRTGRAVDRDRIRYWRAFAAFVMLTIGLDGVRRFDEGISDDVRSAWFQYIVPGLIEDILALIREDRT